MEEVGKVVGIKDDMVTVEVERSAACQGCRACRLSTGGKMLTEARNLVGAGIGDRVRVEIAPKAFLTATFVVFMIPLILLVAGFILGSFLAFLFNRPAYSQGMGVFFGFVFLALSLLIVRAVDRRATKTRKLQPIITQVIEEV